MTLKSTFNTQSTQVLLGNSLVEYLLETKPYAITQGILIPDNLIAEIESFIKRNTLVIRKDAVTGGKVHHCCHHCLKAHALKIASEIGLDEAALNYIDSIFDCIAGHDGYYLDEEELIKFGSV